MVELKDVLAALVDPKNYLTALMYFYCNIPFSSLPVFLPTIIKRHGLLPPSTPQGFTAPPYFLAGIVSILSTFVADRYQQRGIVIMVSSLIGGIGYILLACAEASRRSLSRRLLRSRWHVPRHLQYCALGSQQPGHRLEAWNRYRHLKSDRSDPGRWWGRGCILRMRDPDMSRA
jgi:hypothetical protein